MADNETTTTPQDQEPAPEPKLFMGVRVPLDGGRAAQLFVPAPMTAQDAQRVGRVCAALVQAAEGMRDV